MQSSGKVSQYRSYGAGQEWGAKARKREARQFRASSRDSAIAESLADFEEES